MKPQSYYRRLHAVTLGLAVAVFSICSSLEANEVYRWTDPNGVVHYTDIPPGEQTAETVRIHAAPPVESVTSLSSSGLDKASGLDTAGDPLPEEAATEVLTPAQAQRKKLAQERKSNREARAEIERYCDYHRRRLEKIEPYTRVFETLETGETVRLDDDDRVLRVQVSKDYISKNCN
jgi:hypothetical protein